MSVDLNELMRPRKVCLCRSVSKTDIEKAVRQGADTIPKLVKVTSATTGCGTCFLDVKCALEEAKDKISAEKDPQARLPL